MKRWKVATAAACAVALAAGGCSDPEPGGGGPTAAPGTSAPAGPTSAGPAPTGGEASFASRELATDLENPWEVTWGPDSMLWVTEKSAGRVTRVSPKDGTKRTAVTIPDVLATDGAQDGLLGMALHPGLLKPGPDQYVFVAYTYQAGSGSTMDRRLKIARYTYDQGAQKLGSPVDVITGLPASNDHNSGRLIHGPDGKLYYTIGDQGANQFTNFCKANQAQTLPTDAQLRAKDWSAYQGKILRLNPDGSVPADNPVLNGVRSHIFTYGHRNAQGIAFGPDGRLYSTEQGPKTDDEVNVIEKGRNYGWPRVNGAKDDKAYVYGNWSAAKDPGCDSLSFSDFEFPGSVPQERESTFNDPAFTPPLATFFTVESDHNFRDPQCGRNQQFYLCWPTIAPSGLDVYTSSAVPGWGTSLLIPSLKDGLVYRLKLGQDGKPVGEASPLWRSVNRYRDTAVSGDGKVFYVSTDRGGNAKDRAGRPTSRLENRGAILEFRYTG